MKISPPNETLQELIKARGWTQIKFAEALQFPVAKARRLIVGQRRIFETTAELLESLGFATKEFWLSQEKQYVEYLRKIGRPHIWRCEVCGDNPEVAGNCPGPRGHVNDR